MCRNAQLPTFPSSSKYPLKCCSCGIQRGSWKAPARVRNLAKITPPHQVLIFLSGSNQYIRLPKSVHSYLVVNHTEFSKLSETYFQVNMHRKCRRPHPRACKHIKTAVAFFYLKQNIFEISIALQSWLELQADNKKW